MAGPDVRRRAGGGGTRWPSPLPQYDAPRWKGKGAATRRRGAVGERYVAVALASLWAGPSTCDTGGRHRAPGVASCGAVRPTAQLATLVAVIGPRVSQVARAGGPAQPRRGGTDPAAPPLSWPCVSCAPARSCGSAPWRSTAARHPATGPCGCRAILHGRALLHSRGRLPHDTPREASPEDTRNPAWSSPTTPLRRRRALARDLDLLSLAVPWRLRRVARGRAGPAQLATVRALLGHLVSQVAARSLGGSSPATRRGDTDHPAPPPSPFAPCVAAATAPLRRSPSTVSA